MPASAQGCLIELKCSKKPVGFALTIKRLVAISLTLSLSKEAAILGRLPHYLALVARDPRS